MIAIFMTFLAQYTLLVLHYDPNYAWLTSRVSPPFLYALCFALFLFSRFSRGLMFRPVYSVPWSRESLRATTAKHKIYTAFHFFVAAGAFHFMDRFTNLFVEFYEGSLPIYGYHKVVLWFFRACLSLSIVAGIIYFGRGVWQGAGSWARAAKISLTLFAVLVVSLICFWIAVPDEFKYRFYATPQIVSARWTQDGEWEVEADLRVWIKNTFYIRVDAHSTTPLINIADVGYGLNARQMDIIFPDGRIDSTGKVNLSPGLYRIKVLGETLTEARSRYESGGFKLAETSFQSERYKALLSVSIRNNDARFISIYDKSKLLDRNAYQTTSHEERLY